MLFYEPKFPKFQAKLVGVQPSLLSVLFYEPKFPKFIHDRNHKCIRYPFSALLRAEIPKIRNHKCIRYQACKLSVLFYEPKFPKLSFLLSPVVVFALSVLFYEPKFPK